MLLRALLNTLTCHFSATLDFDGKRGNAALPIKIKGFVSYVTPSRLEILAEILPEPNPDAGHPSLWEKSGCKSQMIGLNLCGI